MNERWRERAEGKLEDIPRKTGKKVTEHSKQKKNRAKRGKKEKAIDVESVKYADRYFDEGMVLGIEISES